MLSNGSKYTASYYPKNIRLEGKITSHSIRKTTCQKLLEADISPNIICQLTGHQNVNSLNNYIIANKRQQKEMSEIVVGKKRVENDNSLAVCPISEQKQKLPSEQEIFEQALKPIAGMLAGL